MTSLYKYCSPSRWNDYFPLDGTVGTIRFTPLSETNDPNEGRILVKGSIQNKQEFNKLAKIIDDEKLNNLLPALKYVSDYEFKKLAENYGDFFREKIWNQGHNYGMFAATKNKNDILMWAHYAANHMGFVIEFDAEHPCFNKPYGLQDILGKFHEIRYVNKIPEKFLSEYYDSPWDIYCTKHKRWEYEKEVRIIYNLEESFFIQGTKIRGLMQIPDNLIRSVIFGCRADYKQWKVQLENNRRYKDCVFFKTTVQENSYELINILLD